MMGMEWNEWKGKGNGRIGLRLSSIWRDSVTILGSRDWDGRAVGT